MPQDAHGISVRVAGWTGSASLQRGVDTVTVTPTGTQSPVQVWKALYDAALVQWGAGLVLGWSVAETGPLTMSFGAVFTLSFGAGNTAARLGFTGGQIGSSVVGDSQPYYSFLSQSHLYTWDIAECSTSAERAFDSAHWPHTPGTDTKKPQVEFICTASEVLQIMAMAEQIVCPGNADLVLLTPELVTVHVGKIECRKVTEDGYHVVTIRCLR